MVRKAIYILLVINVVLMMLAVAVWLMPSRSAANHKDTDTVIHEVRRVYVDTVVRMENAPVVIDNEQPHNNHPQRHASTVREIRSDISTIAKGNPFYHEAAAILSGKLEEKDAANRKMILNYCEHFRTAYTTKDLDFIRQVMSDKALIIVGHVVRDCKNAPGVTGDERVTYSLKTKAEYLSKLSQVFAANKKIDVTFSDFRIMRHPTMEGIYGVTLRQRYKSDRYGDDGWLFLLWDFRNASMPVIHVRTWQPHQATSNGSEVIGIHDFNLE